MFIIENFALQIQLKLMETGTIFSVQNTALAGLRIQVTDIQTYFGISGLIPTSGRIKFVKNIRNG
jgi:UDP-N-acetylglucosamine transferase subunit ALG13